MFIVKSLATPLVWVLILLVLGLVWVKFSRRKAHLGWYAVLLATLILLAFSFPPFANMLTYSLESRVPIPTDDALSRLDVVVVLGGGGYPSGGFRREAELADRSYPRLYHGVRIFQQGHARLLAFCGGVLRAGKESEADIMKAMALQLGVPADQILTETDSSNTMENAAGLADVLPKGAGRCIGLVTSATHMLRSVQRFRKQFPDDTVVPIPVHYRYDPDPWSMKGLRPSVESLAESTAAVHEWIGLLWYAVRY